MTPDESSSSERDGLFTRLKCHLQRVWNYCQGHLNFYRIHLLVFTFTPLIFSVIFWACNGRYTISYVDALFNCVSAITVCGLATVDLSSLTPWQQVILFIQMCLGSPVLVSWVMVYIRRYFFAKSFEHLIEAEAAKRAKVRIDVECTARPWHGRLTNMLRRRKRLAAVNEGSTESSSGGDGKMKKERERKGGLIGKLRTDMIRRMDDAPKLVNPSGWISEGRADAVRRPPPSEEETPIELESQNGDGGEAFKHSPDQGAASSNSNHDSSMSEAVSTTEGPSSGSYAEAEEHHSAKSDRRMSDPSGKTFPHTRSMSASQPFQRYPTVNVASHGADHDPMPRTQTVEFAPDPVRQRGRPTHRTSLISEGSSYARRLSAESIRSIDRGTIQRPAVTLKPTYSTPSQYQYPGLPKTKHKGFGGFPMPLEILSRLFNRFLPDVQRKVQRTMTMPRTTTLNSQYGVGGAVKPVPYISFDAIVGRNSAFYELTNEQLEELGGVEYRALNALLWIVAAYHIVVQGIAYVIVAPYISENKWRSDFVPPALHRPLAPAWFSLFQVVSSYTNTGMSLVDQSIIPFQTAYVMIVVMSFLILAGNTAFPIFLRLTIWIMAKFMPRRSRFKETLHFLLDHPRRCFIYLFPSHQTWFLVTVLIVLNCTDWFSFLVLDIGTATIKAIPVGTRLLIGILQAFAVRAAGFSTVSLSALAPAVKVLYVIMMYVSIYPIAMSVRSTNVYEEQSLGVFEDDESKNESEAQFEFEGPRVTVWSKYLAWHARKQLAFDMWWLGLALVLLCIIERPNIDNVDNQGWFNIFAIIFELVSAYGTVGLSLGIPTANSSFSGALRPLSKLIICAVMIRGRHRGLPVAIDRAVVLPFEFRSGEEDGTGRSEFGRSRTSQVNVDEAEGVGEKEKEKEKRSPESQRRWSMGARTVSRAPHPD